MTQPAPSKPITASQQKILLDILDDDYKKLSNQYAEAAKRAYHEKVQALQDELGGSDEETAVIATREMEAAIEQARGILGTALFNIKQRGLTPKQNHNRYPDIRVEAPTQFVNAEYQRRASILERQLNQAIQQGHQAIHQKKQEARRKILLAGLRATDALELVDNVPTMEQFLAEYFKPEALALEA